MTSVPASDPLWLEKPEILVMPSRLQEFWVTADQTDAEKVNAISRLLLYACVALTLYSQDVRYLMFGVLLIALLGYVSKQSLPPAPRCRLPTANNPYGNQLPMTDWAGNPATTYPACTADADIGGSKHFIEDLYRDVDDLWSSGQDASNIYRNPVTTPTNDLEQFGNFLYPQAAVTCKEGNAGCNIDEDIDLQIRH